MRASWHPDVVKSFSCTIIQNTLENILDKEIIVSVLNGEYDPRFQIDHIRPLYEQKYKQPHEVDYL